MTHSPKHRRGFTLIEVLVVVAIIALLATIGLMVASRARKSANKSQLAFQLQSISVGLEAYQTDFNGLPVTTEDTSLVSGDPNYEIDAKGLRGARTLCKALMGPQGVASQNAGTAGMNYSLTYGNQDGLIGLGFSLPGRSGIAVTADTNGNLKGKKYGPYLAVEKFKISNTATVRTTVNNVTYEAGDPMPGTTFDDTAVLLDANDHPILYYPVLNPQAPIQLEYAYVSAGSRTRSLGWTLRQSENTGAAEPAPTTPYAGTPMYRGSDNELWLPADVLRERLGDASKNHRIDSSEQAAVKGKYILWSCGPDGVYGPNTNANTSDKDKREFDDVTNFQGE